jgi:hypothetical protein
LDLDILSNVTLTKWEQPHKENFQKAKWNSFMQDFVDCFNFIVQTTSFNRAIDVDLLTNGIIKITFYPDLTLQEDFVQVNDWAFAATLLPEDLQREIASLVIPRSLPEETDENRKKTDRYVTLSYSVRSHFTNTLEASWEAYDRDYSSVIQADKYAPMKYIVDPLPPANQSDRFVRIITSDTLTNKRIGGWIRRGQRSIFKNGIMPALTDFFKLRVNEFPNIMKHWHDSVEFTLDCHLLRDSSRHIIITCTNDCLNITFCPDGTATPIRIVEEGREHVISRDRLNVNEVPPAFFDFSSYGTYRHMPWSAEEWQPWSSNVFSVYQDVSYTDHLEGAFESWEGHSSETMPTSEETENGIDLNTPGGIAYTLEFFQ